MAQISKGAQNGKSRLKNVSLLLGTLLVTTLACSLFEREAKASGFGCAGVAGEVVFLDTIYGTGTGLLVSGVIELTHDEHAQWDKRLATGSAIGAGLGLALGVLEVSLRDCSDPSRVNHTKVEPGWQTPRLVFGEAQRNLSKASRKFADFPNSAAIEFKYRVEAH